MTSLSLILCEGAHDQAMLLGLATICGDWQLLKADPEDLPQPFNDRYPRPKPDPFGWSQFEPRPRYLRKDDRCLEVRPLGSDTQVLGKLGVQLLTSHLSDPLIGFGVVVDADDKGVEARVASFRDLYGEKLPLARSAGAGSVVGSSPRIGLWVAPNNSSAGSLLDTLVTAGKRTRPKLIIEAEKFVQTAARYGEMRPEESRAKLITGSAVQVDRPGASLATALMALPNKWFTPDLAKVEPFSSLLEFVDTLTA